MNVRTSVPRLVVAVTLGVVASGLHLSSAVAAPPLPAAAVSYDAIGSGSLPGNVASLGFEATSTAEFGDRVQLAPNGGRPTAVTVVMSSWGCQDGAWNTDDCSTTTVPTFSHPVTLKMYAVDHSSSTPEPGTLLLTKTQTFSIPYRPSADPTNCPSTPGKWFNAADSTCYNGLAVPITFDLSTNTVTVPTEVIWTVSYNTTHYGPSPIGEGAACFSESGGCGYDSLNVGAQTLSPQPAVGTDSDPDGAVLNSSFAGNYCDGGTGGTGTLRTDTGSGCWTDNRPLAKITSIPQTVQVQANPSVTEGNLANVNMAFQLKPALTPAETASLSVQTADGTTFPATAGVDYVAVGATPLSWAAGDTTTRTVNVTIKPDKIDEFDETLRLLLSGGVNTQLGADGVGTILDNDPPPVLSMQVSRSKIEGNSGLSYVGVKFTLPKKSGKPISVTITSQNGTAVGGPDTNPANDYRPVNGVVLDFPPGTLTKTFKVAVYGDTLVEPDETFFLNYTNPVNTTLADTQTTITIVNDD